MVWWVLALGGTFYLLFKKTAPKAAEVFGQGGKPAPAAAEGTGEVEVPVGKRKPGVKPETVADFAGPQYNPANNPFRSRAQAPAAAEAEEIPRRELPQGSLDDVADQIEVSVDEDVPDPDLAGEMDGEDPENEY